MMARYIQQYLLDSIAPRYDEKTAKNVRELVSMMSAAFAARSTSPAARSRDFSNYAQRATWLACSRQGKRDEARTIVTKIYGWFTEGFDTGDLKDAKALLEELDT